MTTDKTPDTEIPPWACAVIESLRRSAITQANELSKLLGMPGVVVKRKPKEANDGE